jgi:Ca-activated chloride channel homolog
MSAWHFKLLGYPVAFDKPAHLLFLIAVLAFLAVGLSRALRRKDLAQTVIPSRFLDRMIPGLSIARPVAQTSFQCAGLFLLALALAQPQCGTRTEMTKRRGIDLVVALDASKSMLARDVQPDRLERAKLELMTLLDELKGDRVGLVIFAGEAFIQCPLTSDYAAAKMFLRAVDPAQMPQGGTNIGAALTLSKQLLDSGNRGGGSDRVVVLLSDGEDLTGEIDEGVKALKDSEIQVLAVGIGSERGEPIPVLDADGQVEGYQKDALGQTVLTRLDKRGLSAVADATGGSLFYRPNTVAMSEVVERIDRLQKSEIESRLTVRYDDRYQSFAFPGLFLWVLGMAVGVGRRRRE